MNQKGYLLMEMLVASVLISMAGSGLYVGYLQGVKADRQVSESSKAFDPLRSSWMRMEHDLRNAAVLREHPFVGKKDEMAFPVLMTEMSRDEKKIFKLFLIRYQLVNGSLVRSEQELSASLAQPEIKKRILLKEVKELSFSYSFLDDKEKIVYENFWLEKPYFGIPRAVKVRVQTGNLPDVSKLIAIPQGRWGHLQIKESQAVRHES